MASLEDAPFWLGFQPSYSQSHSLVLEDNKMSGVMTLPHVFDLPLGCRDSQIAQVFPSEKDVPRTISNKYQNKSKTLERFLIETRQKKSAWRLIRESFWDGDPRFWSKPSGRQNASWPSPGLVDLFWGVRKRHEFRRCVFWSCSQRRNLKKHNH